MRGSDEMFGKIFVLSVGGDRGVFKDLLSGGILLKRLVVLENDIADVHLVWVISENKGSAVVLVLLAYLQSLFSFNVLEAVECRGCEAFRVAPVVKQLTICSATSSKSLSWLQVRFALRG